MVCVELQIEQFNRKGVGVSGKFSIPFAFPGEKIIARVKGRKGILQEILVQHPQRVEPRCKHAGICGGCRWQALAYEAQVSEKEKVVKNLFPQAAPMIRCDAPWRYRNKMEFSFSEDRQGNRYLGLMMARGRVIDLEECHLCPEEFSETLDQVRKWWITSGLRAYHPPSNRGTLRTLTLRNGLAMLTISEPIDVEEFVQAVGTESVVIRIQHAEKGKPTRFEERVAKGSGMVQEHLLGMSFTVSGSAFFQPNTRQAEELYQAAFDLGKPQPTDLVYDLYCGTGTVGILISPHVDRVVGIEIHPGAVEDARRNAQANGRENLTFVCADVNRAEFGDRPDLLFVDPPRAGFDSTVIGKLHPRRIVYISCNPYTQASDIKELKKMNYEITGVQPVDQFPHTPHIENIVALCDKNG